jgi:cytochrome c
MKKYIVICFAGFMAACNPKKPAANSEAANPIVNEVGNAHDSAATGKQLIAGNDCINCHQLNTTVTGPSFEDVAKKYPNSNGVAENLARSIISGSKGVWGNVREMPPHPTIKFGDAVKMGAYILSLKDQKYFDSLNKIK